MTLIEILTFYRENIRSHGREKANEWLHGVCDEKLWEDIQSSVANHGHFIDAEGYDFNIWA